MDFQIDENRIRLNERMMKAMHIFQEKVSVADLEDVTKSEPFFRSFFHT